MRQRKAKDLDKRLQECSEYIVSLPEDGGRSYGEIGSKEPTFQTPEHEAALRALWKECFPRQRDLYLEIGCGKGDFITRKAAKDPASDFLAIEGQETVILRALEKAKGMLLSREMSVRQVAEETGFSDIYAFSKAFRKANDCTPSEYRRKR